MTSELLEAIENVLPNLEEIRERIVQQEVTKANRPRLDKAYVALVDAVTALHAVAYGENKLQTNPVYRNACEKLFPEDFATVGGAS